MKILRNKARVSTVALVLVLTIAATFMTCLPAVNAHTPAWTIPTYAYVSVAPNPVGVGQSAVVTWWLDKVPPTAQGAYGDRWEGVTVTVTKPDTTTQTMGPYTSDPVGGSWFSYVPATTGNYSFQANFPGQKLAGKNPPPGGFGGLSDPAYINDTYAASTSAKAYLTVQQQPVSGWSAAPLPTGYWQRPINAENREWSAIASNWLGGSSTPNNWQKDGQAPKSAHILWAKPLTFGGIVSGTYGDIPYYEGLSYEAYFSAPLIIDGDLYYNTPNPPMYGFNSVDLRTGEKNWWHNGTGPFQLGFGFGGQNYPMLSMGQLLDYESPNQHGVIPYLWSTYSDEFYRNCWAMYDPFTGNWICTIVGVPAAGAMFGASTQTYTPTGIIIYDTTSWPGYIAVWNSTACIQNTFPSNNPMILPNGYWMWRPPLGGTINVQPGNIGYTANATLPQMPLGASIAGIDYANKVLLYATNVPMLGYAPLPTPKNMSFTAVSLKPGELGQKLWRMDWPWPSGNVTVQLGPVGSGVFTIFIKEKMQFYGFSLLTGEQLWGPSEPLGPWDVYSGSWVGGAIAYDHLYYAGYGGILYCYNVKTGGLLWTYAATTVPFESYYGNQYPMSVGTICDYKIYLYSSEHSPTKPAWRGSDLRCVDANTGKEIWKIDCWANTGFGGGLAIADGVLVTSNSYDNQIYAFGKGQSATTVSLPQTTVANGSSVLIQGTITDQSAGAKGTPCISDTSMSKWMEYLYMQQPCPADVTGVPVKLEAFGADGSYVDIGTVMSDAYGNFKSAWTPTKQGLYTIMATFAGSDSYFSSYAATGLNVGPAPAAAEPVEIPAYPDYTPMFAGIIIAVIVAIIIGIVNLLRKK